MHSYFLIARRPLAHQTPSSDDHCPDGVNEARIAYGWGSSTPSRFFGCVRPDINAAVTSATPVMQFQNWSSGMM